MHFKVIAFDLGFSNNIYHYRLMILFTAFRSCIERLYGSPSKLPIGLCIGRR